MQDTKLYQAICDYCVEALLFLKERETSGMGLPTTTGHELKVTNDGTISERYVTRVDWFDLLYKAEAALKELPTYKVAVDELMRNATISAQLNTLVGTIESRRSQEPDEVLRSTLCSMVSSQRGFDFNQEKLTQIYEDIEAFFYTTELRYRYLAPIENFKMDDEKIIIGSVAIIKTPSEDKEAMINSSSSLLALPIPVGFHNYAFELFIDTPKIIGDAQETTKLTTLPTEIARQNFSEVLSALRLYKSGGINYGYIMSKRQSWSSTAGTSFSLPHGAHQSFGQQYYLTHDEGIEFLAFMDFYRRIFKQGRPKIENAISRLNLGLERIRPADKLIDFIFAFESLLLNSQNELQFKLALTAAHLLGNTATERVKIFKVMKQAYKRRSDIAHGNQLKPVKIDGKEITLSELVDLVESCLRNAIKKFMLRCELVDEVTAIKNLEGEIISAGTQ